MSLRSRIGNEETVELVRKEGYKAIPFTVDMSSRYIFYAYILYCTVLCREDIYRAAEKTKEEVGLVTILVNNAGIVSGSTLLETPDTKIVKTFEVRIFKDVTLTLLSLLQVNILAHFWTIKAFMPDMIKHQNGHIVNVASLAGHSGTNKLVFKRLNIDYYILTEVNCIGGLLQQ